MEKYSYGKCRVSIQYLQLVDGVWKGEAVITTGLQSNVVKEQKIYIDVKASDEKTAYAMAARICNKWVDENAPDG